MAIESIESSSSSCHSPHKIPSGDSPYVKAKHAQLVEKDPKKAIALLWSAINSGDRVDSALKDMAVVLKQLDRAEEAIEAIRSFRGRCSLKAQEPLDNVLLDLYKKCGRVTEQIYMLNQKLRMIDEGIAFGGKVMKTARSQGKKFLVTVEQEKSRLLGNLAWAYMQCENYKDAEPLYRRALGIEKDYNKMCNLAICLMKTGRFEEAKILLADVKKPTDDCYGESYQKSFERAWEIMDEMESKEQERSTENPSSSKVNAPSPMELFRPSPEIRKETCDDYSGDRNHVVSCDVLCLSSTENLSSQKEAFLSPASVKVTSQSKPVEVLAYCVERTKTDKETENLVIRVNIQMRRPKQKPVGMSSEETVALTPKDQSIGSLMVSTDGDTSNCFQKGVDVEEAKISFGNLERPATKVGTLSTVTEKKTWADMVEEDELLICENSFSSSLKDGKYKFGSVGGNQQSASNNRLQKLANDSMSSNSSKPGYQQGKELTGRWTATPKNKEAARRSFSFHRWDKCNLGSEEHEPILLNSGVKSCEESEFLTGLSGSYSRGKQRNRLQVFHEITPGDTKA